MLIGQLKSIAPASPRIGISPSKRIGPSHCHAKAIKMGRITQKESESGGTRASGTIQTFSTIGKERMKKQVRLQTNEVYKSTCHRSQAVTM